MAGFFCRLRPTYRRRFRNPDTEETRRARNRAMEAFDRGVVVEHLVFPVVIASGLSLFLAAGWPLGWNRLPIKLAVVFAIFIPMESLGFRLSRFGGN